ncbi:glycosyltransferase, partial [Salmonella enterica subsp. salamae]|nr:glycosyltransferase [Salmonella enterica subsp. salamae]
MDTMLVTIIIACYNAEQYIQDTLDSCINQTYSNVQIIIADDCSKDNSVNIINNWIEARRKTHPHTECILITNDKNRGIPANFNNGLRYAKGEWIKCLGSDDLLVADAISKFVERIELEPYKVNTGAIFTYFETFGDVNISHRYPLAWTKWISAMQPSAFKRCMANIHFNNLAPGAFINKAFLESFDTNYWLLEDLPLWLKLINADVRTSFYDIVSVKYRIHARQVTALGTRNNEILFNDLKKLNKIR